jgi:ABC-2 type transport system permease protein
MMQLTLIELFKIINRPRTYIGFLAIFLTVGAMQLAMYYEGEELISIAIQNLENDFRLEGKIINTNLMTYILLNSLIIHIPILICLVTGDSIAGEASSGTLRLILQKPYSRTQIYLAKALSGFIYTVSLIIFLALMTYVLGYFLFGSGDLIVLRRGVTVISSDDVVWRFCLAFCSGALSMLVVASLSMMISSFVNNAIGPIVGTISIIIGLNIIFTLGAPLFKNLIPYIFTSHFIKWQYFFDFQIEIDKLKLSVIVQLAYIIVFNTIGIFHFNRKDILS